MEQISANLLPYEQVGQSNAQWINDREQLFIQLMVEIMVTKGNMNKGSILFAK